MQIGSSYLIERTGAPQAPAPRGRDARLALPSVHEPLDSGFAPPPATLLAGALALAACAGFTLGVDFPRSNARFSRLAAAD
ncbi:MAG: hypothetical protein HYR75_05675 [Gemmatimonadetes bacterium]|nr:hypothetical protein [Gemmatimonadota bacterium]MBI3566716.1 hypothetical protein [Gemmatimonadota bacterium]